MARGPRTAGTSGSEVIVWAESTPAAAGRMSAAGVAAGVVPERAHAAKPSRRASAPGRRAKTMAARYILAETYATRTLTRFGPFPRFGTLRNPMELWRASAE